MRRTLAVVPTTIALLVVALFAGSAGRATTFTDGTIGTWDAIHARVHSTVDRAHGSATTPHGTTRTLFRHAQPPSIGRLHAPQSNGPDAERHALALRAARASLELSAHRAPGAAVEARARGVPSPGQPLPSSRAPPIG